MLDLPENILNPYSSPGSSSAVPSGFSEENSAAASSPKSGADPHEGADRSAAQAIWRMCLEMVRPQISAQTFRTWFEPLVAVSIDGSEITLRAPSNFFCEWITEHYQDILEKALKEVLGPSARIRFDSVNEIEVLNTKLEASQPTAPMPTAMPSPIAAPMPPSSNGGYSDPQQMGNRFGQASPSYGSQPAQHAGSFNGAQQNYPSFAAPASNPSPFARPFPQQASHAPQPSANNGAHAAKRQNFESNLNPRYTFDTFIRGESNKLAYAAAMAVANNPGGTRYNPLVIYGNVGLGKTHLIQAVGNAVLQKYAGARVLYTSSDRFTVEFVDAIQNDRINDFQSLYRSIDVLIIDDVQFFAGKEKTQDIFFHTFNALRELGKQIILTCDRPPKELKDIDDRLLNRLQWGLTADIGAPDLETRIAILRHKAITDGIELSSDVIEFIATNVTTNIRELEGCLISLLATASLEGREPTIEVAKEVLRKVAKRSAPILSIETIQRAVAKKFAIEEELLRAKTRKQEVVQARQVAMFLSKELTNSSLKTIGLHFGGRDHSTVIHACQTVADDMRHNPQLASKVEELKRQFELMQ